MRTLWEAAFNTERNGVQLDRIARDPIQAIGAEFGHGTGHGIGLTLNVHETPPSISPREREGTLTPFEPGMVTSDEPGIYSPGEWGIRIEHMLVCVEKDDGMLGFETLTQCESDRTLLMENSLVGLWVLEQFEFVFWHSRIESFFAGKLANYFLSYC